MKGCFKDFLIAVIVIAFMSFLMTNWFIVVPVLLLIILLYCIIKYKSQNHKEYKKQNYDIMSEQHFKEYCAFILRENGFYNVTVTKDSGYYGIDILASKENRTYAIQCKKYSSKVGNHAVQEVYSGKDFYNADSAVVMTNNFFMPAAIKTAQKLDVELWDRDMLNSMISNPHISYEAIESIQENDVLDEKQPFGSAPPEIIAESNKQIDTKYDKEVVRMYDVEKGIYPAGEYIAGEDIPLGSYILKQRDSKRSGEFSLYKDYKTYLKDIDDNLVYKSFNDDYHIFLRDEQVLLVVENADIQKI